MGRKPTVNFNLPKGIRARKRGKTVYYYYDSGSKPRKEISLGKDYALAIKKWSELEIDQGQQHLRVITFRYVAERYTKEIIPTKAPQTQIGNIKELANLYKFFDNPPAPINEIEPVHIRKYLDWRERSGAAVRAKREKALFSHIFNKAREWGYTSRANPCAGIRGKKETGRKQVYISDQMYDAIYKIASQPLRDVMDLAYLTGQRPSDVLKMSERDIQGNKLLVRQNKTGAMLKISIQGELSDLIGRLSKRKHEYKVHCLNLIVNEKGQPLTLRATEQRFDRAREQAGISKESFQFRDLRRKAATDKTASSGDIRQAQKQLGHTSVKMTEVYVSDTLGDDVTPTK